MRRLVIGDVHGNLPALTSALERCQYTPGDHLFFLGDYIDRQPHSYEVVEFILSLPHKICIRGNHDQFLIDHVRQPGSIKPLESRWLKNGGWDTLRSYGMDVMEIEVGRLATKGDFPESHLEFLESTLPYFITDDNIPLVHGGLDLYLRSHPEAFYWWDRTMWRTAVKLEHERSGQQISYSKDQEYEQKQIPFNTADTYPCFETFPLVFIGHTNLLSHPNQELCLPQKCMNIWNLDTGAAYQGPLTIMDMDTGEFWQSGS